MEQRVPEKSMHSYLPSALIERWGYDPTAADLDSAVEHLHALLTTLVTYIPGRLAYPILHNPGSAHTAGDFLTGSVVFADISGFTAMSEQLAQQGRGGAEIITQVVNDYFGRFLSITSGLGGDLLKFGGDALLILFDGSDHALRACQAAWRMQAVIADFAQVETDQGEFSLGMHVGVGSGPLFLASLGTHVPAHSAGAAESLEQVIMGPTLAEMGRAESMAGAGEVFLDAATRQLAGESLAVVDAAEGFYRLVGLRASAEARAGTETHPYRLPAGDSQMQLGWLLDRLDALAPYLPPALLDKIKVDPRQLRIWDELPLVTVLFANLMGAQEVVEQLGPSRVGQILQVLDDYYTTMRDIVLRYGGIVNKMGVGPSGPHLIALFGAPLSHEDDPVRATLAALDMHAALAHVNARAAGVRRDVKEVPFQQNIGINTGYVFAGNVGSTTRQEYTVMGDTVNLTARLMAAARPGETLISHVTARHVRGRFALDERTPVQVKGKRKAVRNYRVMGAGTRAERQELVPQRPMVGQEQALTLAWTAVEQVLAGQGQVVVINGEAGVGKTRLVLEVAADARQKGMETTISPCVSYGQNIPYLPWVAVLRRLFDIQDSDSRTTRSWKLESGLKAVGLKEWTPIVGEVLGLSIPDNELTASLDARLRQQRFFDLTTALLLYRASQTPLMLVIEDVYWIDPASLDLLNFLARSVAEAPMLLVIATRPDPDLPDWGRFSHATLIELSALPREVGRALARGLLGVDELPGRVQELVDKAEGNPLFIEEVVRALIDAGGLSRDAEGQWRADESLTEIELPDTIHGLIQSRIDKLAETLRRLLQVASTIGREFAIRLLRAIFPLPMGGEEMNGRLDELNQHELTWQKVARPERVDEFRHAYTYEVAYESLSFARRRVLHRAIGEFVEEHYRETLVEQYGLLAHHYFEGQAWDKALEYSLAAGERAQHEYANQAAIGHLKRALQAADALEENVETQQLEAHERLGDVFSIVTRYDDALEHYAVARSLADAQAASHERNRRLAGLCRKTAEVYRMKSDYEAAFSWLERGLTYPGVADSIEAARIYLTGAGVYNRQGKNDLAIKWSERALTIANAVRVPGADRVIAHVYSLLGGILDRYGDTARAVDYCRSSVTLYERLNDIYEAAKAHTNLAINLRGRGDWDEAIEHYVRALEVMTQVGDRHGQIVISNNLAQLYTDQGKLDSARSLYRQGLEITVKEGVLFGVALLHNNLATTYIKSRDWGQAAGYLQKSLELFTRIGSENYLVEVYRQWAEVYLGLGQLEEAMTWAQRSLEQAASQDMRKEEAATRRTLGRIYMAQSKWIRAEQELENSLQLLEEMDSRYGVGLTCHQRGLLEKQRGRPDQAARYLQQAAGIFEELGARLDMERARSHLGSIPPGAFGDDIAPHYLVEQPV